MRHSTTLKHADVALGFCVSPKQSSVLFLKLADSNGTIGLQKKILNRKRNFTEYFGFVTTEMKIALKLNITAPNQNRSET